DNGLGLFDKETEGVAGLFGSYVEEAEGVGMAVDDAAVGEIEFVSDHRGAAPVKDALLDGFAFGVIADRAVGDVAEEGAVGLSVATTKSLRRLAIRKTPTLLIMRGGWSTRKIGFQVNFGVWWIRRVRFNRNVCAHLSFLCFFEFGAGLTGWE
ncbi:MAG: hypothetical protein ACRD8A_16015, partial [Candidatus Acidiferrales bacterium]